MRKYRNRPTVVDGIRFDSKREAAVYTVLKRRERIGEIIDLELQPLFRFEINGRTLRYVGSNRPVTYRADFSFRDCHGRYHVIDVKGMRTPLYKLKRALMKACHGIVVEEM